LPIIGPAMISDQIVNGVTVASAGGAGMMWGPGVARAAADVALTGRSAVVDTTDLGLDRFDAAGNSRLVTDPIALPFPQHAPQPSGQPAQLSGQASQAPGKLTIT
jgi:sarcosine oxidase subunit beta